MLDIRPLNSELQKIATDCLNETEEKIIEGIAKLREWIANSPYLKARTDEQFLIAFLRFSRHDLNKAKRQLDAFYTLRTKIPEIIKGM